MTDTKTNSRYLDELSRRVLVYDGAMGTNIQRYNLSAEDFGGKSLEGCNDNLVLTRPDVIQAIHESFLAVGCDVVETCTFQSTPRRLHEWGLGDKVRDINIAAAQLARAAADKYCDARPPALRRRPRWVRPACSPRAPIPCSSKITYEELAENYYEQAKYLMEGGVDLLLIETSQDILEVKAAVAGIERLFAEIGRRIPIQAQVTLDVSGRMLLGTDIASAMTTLEALKRRCHRTQLLNGSRAHARADPISLRARDAAAVGDSERRTAAQHRSRRSGLSARAGADGCRARRIRERLRRAHRRRLLRNDSRASRRNCYGRAGRRDAPAKPRDRTTSTCRA